MSAIISCFTDSYGSHGARAAIEHVRDVGIEYVELPIRTHGALSAFDDEPLITSASSLQDLKQVDQLLQSHDVKVSSFTVLSGNPLEQEVVALLKRKIDIASHFSVTTVVGDPGSADGEFELQALYRNLQELGEYCAAREMIYCLDTQPDLCRNHRFMLDAVQAVQHPNVRLNFNAGNLHYYNDQIVSEVAFAKVCHLVEHIHLKDSTGECGERYFPALGYGGAVDFVQMAEIVRNYDYQGVCSIDIDIGDEQRTAPLSDCHKRIVQSVDQLRICGFSI